MVLTSTCLFFAPAVNVLPDKPNRCVPSSHPSPEVVSRATELLSTMSVLKDTSKMPHERYALPVTGWCWSSSVIMNVGLWEPCLFMVWSPCTLCGLALGVCRGDSPAHRSHLNEFQADVAILIHLEIFVPVSI